MTKASSIAKDFPNAATSVGDDEWHKSIAKLLKGKSYEEILCHASDNGFNIDPAPVAESRVTPHQKTTNFTLTSLVDSGNATSANEDILRDLAGGASALHLVLNIDGKAERGIIINNEADFATLLDGVYMDYIPISVEAASAQAQAAEMLSNLYKAKSITPQNKAGIGVYGTNYHNLGASDAQELGFMLASGVAALRQLESAGVDVAEAAKHIYFHMCVDADVFMSMAKLRSFRYMWGEVLKAAGVKKTPATIHAQTSRRMMASIDIETNILRTTAGAFAAMVGGADSLAILPYDIECPSPATHRKARRIARNIGIILDEEGHLNEGDDVAAGSFSVEQLTSQLSDASWEIFQQIEGLGGMNKALADGTVHELISIIAKNRYKDVLAGNKIIVGVNAFKGDGS